MHSKVATKVQGNITEGNWWRREAKRNKHWGPREREVGTMVIGMVVNYVHGKPSLIASTADHRTSIWKTGPGTLRFPFGSIDHYWFLFIGCLKSHQKCWDLSSMVLRGSLPMVFQGPLGDRSNLESLHVKHVP